METKICRNCGQSLEIKNFYKYRCKCKECLKIPLRTRHKVIKKLLTDQRTASRRRGHKPPDYTLQSFKSWVLTQGNFETLYRNWVLSDYDSLMKPSCDRLIDSEPYSFKNIVLTTWGENRAKQLGLSKIKVDQYSLDGKLLNKFESLAQAQRATGIHYLDILKVFKFERLTMGKFIWLFPVDKWPKKF